MNDFNLLKHIRKEDSCSIVVWLFNIGIEKYWNNFEGLVIDEKEDKIVNHVEEMNLLITSKQDYLILRESPSKTYLEELQENGFEIPHIICPDIKDEKKSISEIILEDKKILSFLKNIVEKNENVYLVPYGVSYLEEEIAKRCNLKLIGNRAEKSKQVNNKIFSKEVAKKLGFMTPICLVCHTVDEVRQAYEKLHKKYNRIIVKTPCNASGKGMWLIEDEKKLRTVSLIIARLTRRKKGISWIVEGWIEKKKDLNIQIYVSENGYVEVFSIKEQILNGTVYIGSYIPADLTDEQKEQCIYYGKKIGAYLYSEDFNGIFGIDALITKDEKIVPIIEINGRFTLSTYVSFLEPLKRNKVIYSFYLRKRFVEDFNYFILVNEIKKNGLWYNKNRGLIVYIASTADAQISEGNCRLFCIAIGDSKGETKILFDEFEKTLGKFQA